jgi:hypothetical protein
VSTTVLTPAPPRLEALPAPDVAPQEFEKAARATIIDWRRKFLAANKLTNTRLNRLLAQYHAGVVREVTKIYKPGMVPSEAQVQLLSNRIAKLTNRFNGNVRNLMQASVASAADVTAIRESQIAAKTYSKLLPKQLAAAVVDPFKKNALSQATLDTMWNHALGGSKVSLSKKVWAMGAQTHARVTAIVREGIDAGLHPIDVTDMLQGELISKPGTGKIWSTSSAPPRLKKLVSSRGGTVSYNHLRVARTEMLRASLTAHKLRVHFLNQMPKALNPVIGIKWNLSGSHPKLDICDEWATDDKHNLGPGVYPPTNLPMGHANDLCFTSTEMNLKGYKQRANKWLLDKKTTPADTAKMITMSAGNYLSPRNRSMLAAIANNAKHIPPFPMTLPKGKPKAPVPPPKPKAVVSKPKPPPAPPAPPEPILPGIEWKPSMPLGDATKFAQNSKITKSVYHGSPVHPNKLTKTGLRAYADDANQHAGISFSWTKPDAATYGRNVYRAKVHVQNPLKVNEAFWKGTSASKQHQKVYAQLKKKGIHPKKASIGQMSLAAEEAGFDAWMSATELRMFSAQRVALVKPKTIPKKPKAPEPAKGPPVLDASKMKKVGEQKGSNLGGLYEDADGVKWYIKTPKTVEHARNEVLAARLYKAAGVENVPEVQLARLNGKAAVASRYQEGLVPKKDILQVIHKAGAVNRSTVMDGFTADAWLANWDVVGLQYDNLLIKKGVGGFYRIDTGGALRFRAMGGAKGSAFGPKVVELDTMLAPAKNAQSASTFRTLTYEEFKKGMSGVVNVTQKQIDDLLALYGPTDPIELNALRNTLIARQESIKAQSAALRSKLPSRMVKGVDVPVPPIDQPGGGLADVVWKKTVDLWTTKKLPTTGVDPKIVSWLQKWAPHGGFKPAPVPKPAPPPPAPTQVTAQAAVKQKQFVAPEVPTWWKTKAIDPSDDMWQEVVGKWMTGKPLGKVLTSTKTGYLTKWDKQWLEKHIGPKGASVGKAQPPGLNINKYPKAPSEMTITKDEWKALVDGWVDGMIPDVMEPLPPNMSQKDMFFSLLGNKNAKWLEKQVGPFGSKRIYGGKTVAPPRTSIDTSKKHWKWADDQARPWQVNTVATPEADWARLTLSEQQALRSYTGGGYRAINKTLRSLKRAPRAGTNAGNAVSAIDKATPFKTDNYVWRSFSTNHMGFSTRQDALNYFRGQIGTTHEFKGIVSTSYSPSFAFGWGYKANKVVFEIKTRKGFKIATKSSSGAGENELLINHGVKYRIVDVKNVTFKDRTGISHQYTLIQVEVL